MARLTPRARNGGDAGPINEQMMPLDDLLADLARGPRRPKLCAVLPRNAFFLRDIALPHAARRNVAALLALDLERATPFKASEVYAGHVILDKPDPRGQQALRHAVLKKSTVDRLRARLSAAGCELAGVACAADGAAPQIPLQLGDESARGSRSAAKPLAALIIALVAVAAFLGVHRQHMALGELTSRTAEVKAEVQAIRALQEAATAAEAVLGDFNVMRRNAIARAAIIEELTRLLPDSAYVNELKIQGNSVDVSGFAEQASALIPLLEGSTYFVDARALSPVSFDQARNKERFGIRMALRGAGASEGDPAADLVSGTVAQPE